MTGDLTSYLKLGLTIIKLIETDVVNAEDSFQGIMGVIEEKTKALNDVKVFVREYDKIYIDPYFLELQRGLYHKSISK